MGGYALNNTKYQYFVIGAKSLNNSISINTTKILNVFNKIHTTVLKQTIKYYFEIKHMNLATYVYVTSTVIRMECGSLCCVFQHFNSR